MTMHGHHFGSDDWPTMLAMMTAMTALTAVVIAAVVLAARHRPDGRRTDARALLDRYARGEVASDEYRERRAELARP